MRTFHYLTRGIIISNDHILLAREIGAGSTFLPGGHIEHGESAKRALAREVSEETGVMIEVGGFLGAVEATWQRGETRHAEINLVFSTHGAGLSPESTVESKEDHLEFIWANISEIDSYNLLPEPMREIVKDRATLKASFWGSTIE